MYKFKLLAAIGLILLLCVLVGCNKKSALEGKILDGRGQPIEGVKVIAKLTKSYKENSILETTTQKDGVFKFVGLFPSTGYDISVVTDKYNTNHINTIKIVSGPDNLTQLLPAPIELRFATPEPQVAIDTNTGLMWATDANIFGRKLDGLAMMKQMQNINYAGYNDWRLPTKEEWSDTFKGSNSTLLDNMKKIGFKNMMIGEYWTDSRSGTKDHYYATIGANGDVNINKKWWGFINGYVWIVRSNVAK